MPTVTGMERATLARRNCTLESLNRKICEDFEALTLPRLDPVGYGKVERLWQHDETGCMVWREECPGEYWHFVPIMHEDELPRNMTDRQYNQWFQHSHVPGWVGCRMGPRV